MNRFLMPSVVAFITLGVSGCTPYPQTDQTPALETSTSDSTTTRQGPKPSTTQAPMNTNIAHQQIDQTSPIAIQEQLRSFMSSLPGVQTGGSRLSVAGARALSIPGTTGPVIEGDEWVHLHPSYDGSLHIALDIETMRSLVHHGWGEYHPRNPNSIMLYGPRDEKELSFIKDILLEGLALHQLQELPGDTQEKAVLETPHVPLSTQALIQETFLGSDLRLEAIESSNAVYTRYRISYLSDEIRVSGIMNIPVGEGPFPLIILNHGYIDPAVYTVGRGLKREQDFLARNGFAVLHTDYRNHGLSDDDSALEENYVFRNYFYTQDSINAILAVQNSSLPELTSIDSENVGMLGHSMGGGVTMHALIARPDLIDAAVLYAPVHASEWYNFDRWRNNDLTTQQRTQREQQLGGLSVENFMPYSATPYLSIITAPVQIYFGTNDESVPYQRGVEIQQLMQDAGVDSELITYQGERHEFISQFTPFMQGVRAFFDRELR